MTIEYDCFNDPDEDFKSEASTPETKPKVDALSGYLTKVEAAVALRISTKTLDRWHRLRMGPPRYKMGKAVYYKITLLEAWREKNQKAQSYEFNKKTFSPTGYLPAFLAAGRQVGES